HQRGETAGHNVPLARLAREHAERRVLRQPKIEADEALQRTEFRFLRRNAPCRRGLATRPFARFNLYRRRHFLPCVPLLSDNRAGFQPRANSLNSNFLCTGIGAKIRAVSDDVGAADPIFLLRSWIGVGLTAMRDNEEGAAAIGVNITRAHPVL